jgi:hypothetical protein
MIKNPSHRLPATNFCGGRVSQALLVDVFSHLLPSEAFQTRDDSSGLTTNSASATASHSSVVSGAITATAPPLPSVDQSQRGSVAIAPTTSQVDETRVEATVANNTRLKSTFQAMTSEVAALPPSSSGADNDNMDARQIVSSRTAASLQLRARHSPTLFLVCGPDGFCEQVAVALRALHVSASHIVNF